MRRFIPILLAILVLSNAIIAVALWGTEAYFAIQYFRSPIRALELPPQAPLPGQTSRLVIVLVSGLGQANAETLTLPTLAQLQQSGVSMVVNSAPPTYAQTSWATIVTGANAEINDGPPFDKPLPELHPLETDTIFQRAQEANLQTALFASAEWQRMIPPDQLDYAQFATDISPEADNALIEAALPVLEAEQFDLVLIQLNQLRWAVETQGGPASEGYQEAAQRIDAHLNKISQFMNLGPNILVILSDHGYLANGGHGGDEPEITQQPLVMLGGNLLPGEYSTVRQVDIAPTMAVLLGLAPPTAAQGRILFEILRLNDRDRAASQLTLARQRIFLSQAYISVMHGRNIPIPASLAEDLARAEMIFANNNINGTFELASLIRDQAEAEMNRTRYDFINQAQGWRLVIMGSLVLLWAITMWQFRGPYMTVIIFAAVSTVALYHGLYQLQGHSYSLSSIQNFAELPLEITRRATVSMFIGGGILLIVLLFSDEGEWLTLLGVGYGFGVLVTFLFALPVFWAFWQNGLAPRWFLPEPLPAFWQITGIFEVAVAATLGLLLPWPIMSLNVFVSLVRYRLYEADKAKAGTLPGLRL